MMRFLSCFSGIEAASAAFLPLGWKCVGVAEVDKAASRVLAHHFPDVENLGDVEADDFLARVEAIAPDVLIGGPPCQDFSIAGLRAGIYGARGNLTLRWVQIIHATRARFSITENVPGWLSANDGHAFGAFLAALVGHDTDLLPPANCGGRWTDAGMVAGPVGRACWRILDAQFHGLAQRRRRVFIVFCFGDRGDPASVLLESKSVRRHTSPRREAGKTVTGTLAARTRGGGGLGTDFDLDGGLIAASVAGSLNSSVARGTGQANETDFLIANTLSAARGAACVNAADLETYIPVAFGGNNCSGPIDVATALLSHGGPNGHMDFASETFIAHALRAEGFDASEDGTGRGTPIVPVCFDARQSDVCVYGDRAAPLDTDGFSQAIAFAVQEDNQNGVKIGDIAGSLRADAPGTQPCGTLAMVPIAFSSKDHGADATSDLAPTMRSMGHDESHANGGGQLAVAIDLRQGTVSDVTMTLQSGGMGEDRGLCPNAIPHTLAQAFDMRGREGGAQFEGPHDTANIRAASGGSSRSYVAQAWAVRRLTPLECERLQGFPDNYTLIPDENGKGQADGPRYRQLGNSFAVPVVRWLGKQILVDAARHEGAAA